MGRKHRTLRKTTEEDRAGAKLGLKCLQTRQQCLPSFDDSLWRLLCQLVEPTRFNGVLICADIDLPPRPAVLKAHHGAEVDGRRRKSKARVGRCSKHFAQRHKVFTGRSKAMEQHAQSFLVGCLPLRPLHDNIETPVATSLDHHNIPFPTECRLTIGSIEDWVSLCNPLRRCGPRSTMAPRDMGYGPIGYGLKQARQAPGVKASALVLAVESTLLCVPIATAQSGTTEQSGATALTPPSQTSTTAPTPAGHGDSPPPKPEPLPWRNSIAVSSTFINTTAFGNADLTHNPTIVTSLSLRPRWYVTDTAFLGLRQDVTLELTDTDCVALYSTCRTRNREPFLSDSILSFFENSVWSYEHLTLAAGASVSLPTSIASRNRGMVFAAGPILRATYVIPDALAGVIFQAISSYRYTFGGSSFSELGPYANSLGAESRNDLVAAGAQGDAYVIGGPSPQSHAGNVTLLALVNPIPNLNVLASFSWLWRQPNEGEGPFFVDGVLTSPEGFEVEGSNNQFRLFTVFGLSVSYNFASWLNVGLNYSHFTTEFAPDGGRRNPFWSEDSTVGLSATLTVDQLYRTLQQGGSEGNPLENMVAERDSDEPSPNFLGRSNM